MRKLNEFFQFFTRSPLVWGTLGAVGFYSLVHAGPLDVPLVKRYFTNHPVEYMETAMFAIGLAILVLKCIDPLAQRVKLGTAILGPPPKLPQPVETCGTLLMRLDRLSGRRNEYYVCRLRAALEHVSHRGSADALDDELKYLSDLDASRLYASYALFRVIVWAIPILGFLGTVIGITMMLGGAAKMANGGDQASMLEIFQGLALKFDTTALALTFSILLMFVHFTVERSETALLDRVDDRARAELAGRFAAVRNDADGQLVVIRQMAETMVQTAEMLAGRQAELWRAAVEAAGRQWSEMAQSAGGKVQSAMSEASNELVRQAAVLQRAVEAVGEVTRLEDSLNRNLSALAGAKHFEQTVMSLAAAVNMLSARLAESPLPAAPIRLDGLRRSAHAA
jgi:hypothetical protein